MSVFVMDSTMCMCVCLPGCNPSEGVGYGTGEQLSPSDDHPLRHQPPRGGLHTRGHQGDHAPGRPQAS